jgi:hypothetical protein
MSMSIHLDRFGRLSAIGEGPVIQLQNCNAQRQVHMSSFTQVTYCSHADQEQLGLYRIPHECGAAFIGETRSIIEDDTKEHKRD